MNKQKVIENFCMLAKIRQEDTVDFTCFINPSITQVESITKDPNTATESAMILEYLAAAFAYYRYILANFSQDEQSIKTLDLSITNKYNNYIKAAIEIRDDAIAMASAVIIDTNFCFRTV